MLLIEICYNEKNKIKKEWMYMITCNVYVGESETKYEGQYEFKNDCLEVEVFNYHASNEEYVSIGTNIKYKEITIVDLRNKMFAFSPVFHNVGVTFALTQYEKYKADFYMTTGQVDNIDAFSRDMKIRTLTLYHPMLMQCFANPALQITHRESEVNYKVIKNSEKKIVEIQENNIREIEFGGRCIYSKKNNGQTINIDAENYAKIYLMQPINYEEILIYINEFDVFMNTYCPSGLHSYATWVTTNGDKCFEVVHKLLGKDKFYIKSIHKPVKLDFFEYMERMYKK